jgi:hypothetical protein
MINNIVQQFENLDRIKIFEIEVMDERTKEIEYIIFDISIEGNKFIAKHEPTTYAEEESNKIAYTEIEIDESFTLDEHLQNLYSECVDKIIKSDFFTLID